jgi:phosphohistidine phosphatase
MGLYPAFMRLYLVRHAEAEQGEPDELRRLTPSGRAAARALGERLAAETLDSVLTSPLLRARETADEIARAAAVEAQPDDRLAPGATSEDVLAAVAGRGDGVVVVGHQPDCGRVAAELSGREEPRFPPAGMVVIDL